MIRYISIVGSALAVALIALLAYNYVQDPMVENRTLLAEELNLLSDEWQHERRTQDTTPEQLERIIISQSALWDVLVPPPPPPRRQFDMDGAMRGINPTRRSLGTGDDIQVRIETPGNPRGDYYGVGDVVDPANGITVKEIAAGYVVFAKMDDGVEYTKRVAR